MEGIVYLICAATALSCSFLLLRTYLQARSRLLLWCGLCFLALALENAALFTDLIMFPLIDLSAAHLALSLIGTGLLLYGLVWETKS